MALTMSHVAGPTTPAVREMTFGDLLRKAAEFGTQPPGPDRWRARSDAAAAMDLR